MRHRFVPLVLAFVGSAALLAAPIQAAGLSRAEESLADAAKNQRYTFLVFYKDNSQAAQTLSQTIQASVSQHAGQAMVCSVSVQDASEKAVVKRFGVSRAPLPVAIAVAPNGAITAVLSQKATPAQVSSAFVTAGMAECMKAMQEEKVVLVCVKPSFQSPTPAAVTEFQADPEFKNRSRLISVQTSDRGEELFFKQLAIDPASVKGEMLVFLAPPGIVIGKFGSTVTKADIAAALQAAGKCCDDPNCKHNHDSQVAKPSNGKRN